MKANRNDAVRAFTLVRAAQQAIDSAVARGASVTEVSELLGKKFDPAIRVAKEAGVFTGYFHRWELNLCSEHPRTYPMVAQPSNLGWTVVAQEKDADVEKAQKALDALIRIERSALQHAKELPPEQAEAQRVIDEQQILKAVSRVQQAGVDPIFLDAEVDQVDARLRHKDAELPVYPYVARVDSKGEWKLEELQPKPRPE